MANKERLGKGIQYLFGAIPLMFIGPSIMYNAFMNKNNNWHYLVLVIGCCICIGAVFLAFVGIRTITNSLFDGDK